MAELYQLYADKQAQIENVVRGLVTSGMISMEEADQLESLVPGEIANLDPNIIFDLDPSSHGSKIALEAALAGLDKVKIAFIVAVIAFILRYISSLHNSAGYSFGGGSGGGWGGSAPSTFKTNAKPASAQFSQDVADHQNLLIEDFKTNHEKFMEQFDKFKPWASNVGHLKALKDNKSFKQLIEVTLKDILNRNVYQDEHGNGYFFSEGEKNTAFSLYASGKGMEGNNLSQLGKVLEDITRYYTPKSVFTVNVSENRFNFPKFVLHEEFHKSALEFINLTKSSAKSLQQIETDVRQFINKLKASIHQEMGAGVETIFQWVGDHFIVSNKTATADYTGADIGLFLVAVCSIQVPSMEEFQIEHRITVENTQYLDTAAIAGRVKQMIKTLTSGEVSEGQTRLEVKTNDSELDKMTRAYFDSIAAGKAKDVDKITKMSQFIPIIEEYNEALESGYKNFEELQDLIQDFIRSNADLKEVIEQLHPKEDDDEVRREGDSQLKRAVAFRTCLDLTYNALIALSSCFAGVATMGAQIQKFEVAKVNKVIGKLNEMNKHYFDLTQNLIRINEATP